MKRAPSWKTMPKWCKLAGLVYLLVVLYVESLCYIVLPWTWPSTSILETLYPQLHVHDDLPGKDPKVLRILLVADPQIQGHRNEPAGFLGVITRWDSDR